MTLMSVGSASVPEIWGLWHQVPRDPPSSGVLAASLTGCGFTMCFGLETFGIFRSLVGFQSRHFWLPPRLPSLFSLTHVLFVALVSHRHSFSSSRSRSPSPSPLSPLSPRKEKIQTLTNKISAIPSEGELRQEPRISWKKRQQELKASVV